MAFRVESRTLDGVVVVRPEVLPDLRGQFTVMFERTAFGSLGLPTDFVQENCSVSKRGVVRGLHFQWEPQMGKLMYVSRGRAFLVAVDIRKHSPTIGKWFGLIVSSDEMQMVWAPPGFARGFCALTDDVVLQYKCTAVYNPKGEGVVSWRDPQIGIDWPVSHPILSPKDSGAPSFAEWLSRPESSIF